MKIAVGSDHRGDDALGRLVPVLRELGHDVIGVGPNDGSSRDYPDEAWLVGRAVSTGEAERGILICGSGIGVSIAANKVRGVRAALVCHEQAAMMSRKHNDANVLCLSGDALEQSVIEKCARAFLATDFEGGRHARRVEKIALIERGGMDEATKRHNIGTSD
jgi:ribose 5-phosphate isomerase B